MKVLGLCILTISLICQQTKAQSCFGGCTDGLMENIMETVGEDAISRLAALEVDAVIDILADSDKFLGLCSLFDKLEACVGECPSSFFKTILEGGGREMVQYFCVTRREDILRYLPCATRVPRDKPCQESCKGIIEGPLGDTEASELAADVQSGSFDGIESIAHMACKFVHCHLGCDIEQIEKECSAATSDLMLDLVHHTVTGLRRLAQGTGLVVSWPESCMQLQEFTTVIKVTPVVNVAPVPNVISDIVPNVQVEDEIHHNQVVQAEAYNGAHALVASTLLLFSVLLMCL